MLNLRELHYVGDFMASEIYGQIEHEFILTHYIIKNFPMINLYINHENDRIVEVLIDDEYLGEVK